MGAPKSVSLRGIFSFRPKPQRFGEGVYMRNHVGIAGGQYQFSKIEKAIAGELFQFRLLFGDD